MTCPEHLVFLSSLMTVLKTDIVGEWSQVLRELMVEIPKSSVLTYFKDSSLTELSETTCTISVFSVFAKHTIEDKFYDQLLVAVQKIMPTVQSINLVIREKEGVPKISIQEINRIPGLDVADPSDFALSLPKSAQMLTLSLNQHYSFENCVVGSHNQLAYSASLAISKKPGMHYNPLFIYGGVGLGKTHLLHAIGNEIKKSRSGVRILYATSEFFVNEVIEAIRKRKTDQLRSKYRNVDVLIVDDIQFLAGKDSTQTEFFHTFNTLYEAKKQIVLTSDRPPSELTLLEPRLKSRFEMGMIVDIDEPDYETRFAILRTKCQEKGVCISDDVLQFIATNVQGNVRELEGILTKAIAQYEIAGIVPTLDIVTAMMRKLRPNHAISKAEAAHDRGPSSSGAQGFRGAKSMDEIASEVSRYYQVGKDAIIGESRRKDVQGPRQIAMYIAKHDMRSTLESIGAYFGGRLHSTVLHAIRKIEEQLSRDDILRDDLNHLRDVLGFHT